MHNHIIDSHAGLSNNTLFFCFLSLVCFLALGFTSIPFSLDCLAGLFPFALVASNGLEPEDMGNSMLMGSGWF